MIRLRLMGPLSLKRDDGTPVRSLLAQPKRFALLAFLAASHPSAPRRRDTLLGLFWPESDEEHARNSLRQNLYHLRSSLGAAALTGEGGERVGVDRDRLWCDAAAFDDLLADNRPEEALELYRGEFLEGFHLSGVSEFERWMENERRRRRLLALEAAWELAEVTEAEGDRAGARAWAEDALELAPYDEEGLRRYLNLMHRIGQPATAVRAYEAYAERLSADLDLRPSPETTALIDRVRRGQQYRPPSEDAGGGSADQPSRSEEPLSRERDGEQGDRDSDDEPSSTSIRTDELNSYQRLSSLAQGGGRRNLLIAGALALGFLAAVGITAVAIDGGVDEDRPRIRSLAVLPLENLSADPEQEYFTDGMTEALIAELGEIGTLDVISRTSAMTYRSTERRLPEIARELGADALIEGSVLKADNEVRITLQLIHGPTDRHMWSRSFERDLRDVLALQGEVARSIAREIQITVAPETEERLARADTVDPDAYEAYLKGRYRYSRATEEDHRAAISHYREALEHDSTFARAYAGLAQVCIHPSVSRRVTRPADCHSWATRAVELAPDLAEAHAALGHVRYSEWEWEGAEAAFRRAIELSPSSVMARTGYADFLWMTAREEESLEHYRRAEELDPLNLFVKTAVSWPLLIQGRNEAAVEQLDEVLEMNPDFWLPLWNRGEALVTLGRATEALEAARRLDKLPGDEASISAQALRVGALGVTGEEERALEILTELEERAGDAIPARLGLLHLRLEREEQALAWFERAFRGRDPFLPAALSLPESDVLRDRLRFQALMQKTGLDEYASL